MKKLIFIMLCMLVIAACDKIKIPNPNAGVKASKDNLYIVTNTNNNERKVLMEDYTGHTCGNCPAAARILEGLETTYGDRLIVMANHVSKTFAAPITDTMYKEDFRCGTATDWDLAFGMSSAGLPKGMVNRTTPFPQAPTAWTGLIATALSQAQTAKLDVTSSYDTVQQIIQVKVKTTFLKSFSSDVMMIAALTQDGLIGEQRDYSPPTGVPLKGTDRRTDYKFEAITIGSINGSTGQLVKSNPTLSDTVTVNTTWYDLKNKCFYSPGALAPSGISAVCVNDKKVNLIVFLYDNSTKEVLQAEKIRIWR